jgi:hypothetical protein
MPIPAMPVQKTLFVYQATVQALAKAEPKYRGHQSANVAQARLS